MNYALMNRFVSEREAVETRARILRRGGSLNLINPEVDEYWARLQKDTSAPRPYYDYFFSGQDIKVYVAELSEDTEFKNLPLHGIGFNVSQEKAPIYGMWDFTFTSVMRGTRLVTGSFTLFTKSPDYMKRLLTKAASERANNHRNLTDAYPSPSSWREDDANIERYWGLHLDPSAQAQDGIEWSIHPPFSLVVVYGVQDTSVEVDKLGSVYNNYQSDNALLFDHNQRLVEGFNPNHATRIILDHCELMSVERDYTSDAVIAETYQFFARDIFIPPGNWKRNQSTSTNPSPDPQPSLLPGTEPEII